MAQTSALDACLEIAAEMRAIADDPEADITTVDRRALMTQADETERSRRASNKARISRGRLVL